jgi:hypothetical protein
MKQYLPPALQRKLWGLLIQAEENRSLPPARATWQVEVKTIRRLGTNHVGLDRVVPRRGEAVEWIPYVTLFSAATATAISAALSRRGIPARVVVHTLGPGSSLDDMERLAAHVRRVGHEAIEHAQRGRSSPFLEVG